MRRLSTRLDAALPVPTEWLPADPPRRYGLRDAYRHRVWRSLPGALGREAAMVGLALVAVGFLRDEGLLTLAGGLLAAAGGALALGGGLVVNLRRVRLVRAAPAVPARLGHGRRVLLLHELFRGERERTYVLPYTFRRADGSLGQGRVWICGCARRFLPDGREEQVAFDAGSGRSLPLRLAVMVAPH